MGKNTLGNMAKSLANAGHDAADAAKSKSKALLPGSSSDLHGPSTNPHTNLLIADIALRSSSVLARRAVERGMLGSKYSKRKASAILKGRSFTETLLHSIVARIATRSMPGAILVGGGLVAKTLYDRARSRQALYEGEDKLQEMAEDGED